MKRPVRGGREYVLKQSLKTDEKKKSQQQQVLCFSTVRILAVNIVAGITSRAVKIKYESLLHKTGFLPIVVCYPLPLLVHHTSLLCVTLSCRMLTLHVAVDVNSKNTMVIISDRCGGVALYLTPLTVCKDFGIIDELLKQL